MERLFSIILLSLVLSCSGNPDVSKAVDNREKLLREFTGLTFGKRGNDLRLIVSHNGLSNYYSFTSLRNGKVRLNETIENFNIQEIDRFRTMPDKELSRGLEALFERLISLMNEYNISGFNLDFGEFGIDLVIYLPTNKELIYTKDRSNVTNPEWRKYVDSAEFIDDNWYLATIK